MLNSSKIRKLKKLRKKIGSTSPTKPKNKSEEEIKALSDLRQVMYVRKNFLFRILIFRINSKLEKKAPTTLSKSSLEHLKRNNRSQDLELCMDYF